MASVNQEELDRLTVAYRKILDDLVTSHRDFGLLLADGYARPSAWLVRLFEESLDEARRLVETGESALAELRSAGWR